MVYKPRKTVNGHKRNDRSTRRRKARDARKRRAAARPVRSNIKRYVAQQFGKTHPDNRYYLSYPALKPTNKLDDTPRYYPFGAHFQKEFLDMEFRRMKEVVTQIPAHVPIRGGRTSATGHGEDKYGNFNHWKSLLGRGIHMKHSSVYGTITLNENIPLKMQSILKYGNLKLHMFVLEDKAVSKTEFLNWYKDLLQTNTSGNISSNPTDELVAEQARNMTASNGPINHGVYDKDILGVPYVAGSKYASGSATVCGEGDTSANERPPSGFDEFLIDWRKFYETNTTTNPVDSLFYNEVKCTTDWDGSRDKSLLPVNKSRFIVHEHKTWSFKPRANGCLDTVIPFEYSFPEHYMHYDKEILDLPFVWNSDNATATRDDRGIRNDWMFTRKQPFIVFVYTCDNPHMLDGASHYHDVDFAADSVTPGDVTVKHKDLDHTGTDIKDGNESDDPSSTAMDITVGVGLNPENTVEEQQTGDLHVKRTKTDAAAGFPSGYTTTIRQRAILSAETTTVAKGDVFSIDMHFKCTYENKLATSVVPTINKGRPIIHKRESQPRTPTKRKASPPSTPPRAKKSRISKKRMRQGKLPEWMSGKKPKPNLDAGPSRSGKRKAPFTGPVTRSRKLDEYLLKHPLARAGRHPHPDDPTRAVDDVGLDKAYASNDGCFIDGDTMYIAGTGAKGSSGGHLGDALLRWHLIAKNRTQDTERYSQAMRRLLTSKGRRVKYLVGHSYGAAVADRLTRDHEDFTARLYGAARYGSYHPRILSFRHSWDPVSMIDFDSYTDKNTDPTAPLPSHGYHGYAWMKH